MSLYLRALKSTEKPGRVVSEAPGRPSKAPGRASEGQKKLYSSKWTKKNFIALNVRVLMLKNGNTNKKNNKDCNTYAA